MDPTYTPALNSANVKPPNYNRLKFTLPTARLTTQSHMANLIGKLIRSLAYVVPTGSRQAISVFCQLLEHMLRNNKSNQHDYLLDIFDMVSVLYSISAQNQRLWLQIRALFLTILRNKSIAQVTRHELTLTKAQFSPAQEFNKSIQNEQITSELRAALESIFRLKPYVQDANGISGQLYLFLAQSNLIQIGRVDVISQQWLVNKLYIEKQLLTSPNSALDHHQEIIQWLESADYNSDLKGMQILKSIDRRTYVDCICRQIQMNDSLQLWIQLRDLNPTVAQMIELTKIYEQYHLDKYLKSKLEPQCDLAGIVQELSTRESLIKKYTICEKLTKTIEQLKIIDSKAHEPSTWASNQWASQTY